MKFSFARIEQDDLLIKALQGVLPLPLLLISSICWGGSVGESSGFYFDTRRGVGLKDKYEGLNLARFVDPVGIIKNIVFIS